MYIHHIHTYKITGDTLLSLTIKKYHQSKKGKEALARAQLKYIKKQRVELVIFLGKVCVDCGFSDMRALQLDHKNNDGNKDRKKFGNAEWWRFYNKNRKLAKEKLQVLCANCNWIKRCKKND